MAEDLGTSVLEVDGDLTPLGKKLSEAQSLAKKQGAGIGTALQGGIRKAALPAAAALGLLAVGAIKAVDAASDLGEQINKATVVFRGSEDAILSWSKTTASALGISQRAALEAAGTFGNMLVPMGIARDLAGQMSMKIVELAADMASFNNASPEETLDALRAGLAGETEPLRRFGVFLNEARIQEEALRLGLIKQGEDLDAAAKAQATYSIILKDTTDAQGDFARTSDSLANSQRIMRAEVEDLAAQLGMALLPAVQSLLGIGLDLVQMIGENQQAFTALVVIVGAFAASIIAANASLTIYNAAVFRAVGATRALRLAMATTPFLALGVAVLSLIEFVASQRDTSEEATDAQRGLTDAVNDYHAALQGAKGAREEYRESSLRLETAEIALKRAQQAERAVLKDQNHTALDAAEAHNRVRLATESVRDAQDEVTKSGLKLRNEQAKGTNAASRLRGITAGLAETYRRKVTIAQRQNQETSEALRGRMSQLTGVTGSAADQVDAYARELRKAANIAQADNPKLAATARIAADLASAWGRVVSLPEARHFVATFKVTTTLEQHRVEVQGEQASGTRSLQSSGTFLTGERGPELVTLPRGTRIDSAMATRNLGRAGGQVIENVLVLDGEVLYRNQRRVEERHVRRNGG